MAVYKAVKVLLHCNWPIGSVRSGQRVLMKKEPQAERSSIMQARGEHFALTFMPAAASLSAMPRPKPVEAPVTRATLPARPCC